MAVLPKKYSKRGPVSVEDYILYMCERIEFDASTQNQKIADLTKKCEAQAKELAELKKITGQET